MVGKWHLCPTDEMNLASTRRNWPSGRGFERCYGFLGAETNQWYPDLVYDNHSVDQPRTPEEGYHLTDDITDKALEFIKDAKAVAPDKPFFLYYAPGACHAPHHAPQEWIERFKGQFDHGLRGHPRGDPGPAEGAGDRPADTGLPPINPIGTPDSRTGPRRQAVPGARLHPALGLAQRRREGALRPHGRGLRRVPGPRRPPHRPAARLPRAERELDNTLVILVSDNGASGEGGPNGSVNEMKFANGVADDLAQNLAKMDDLGGPRTYNHYPNGWAMAFNTPFKMWKRYEFNGGTCDPCIISWPAGTKARGEIREQYYHAIDIVPTVLDILGDRPPRDDQGPHAEPPRRGEHALQHRRRVGSLEPEDPVLRHARLPGHLA